MSKENFDWIVTGYDEDDNAKVAFIIKNRTESQADKEASSEPDIKASNDWTMMKMDDEVKRFIGEFGMSQKEVKEAEGFRGSSCAVSEMAINFGYVWIDKFKKWLNKNNSCYDIRDEEVLNYIRKKYC